MPTGADRESSILKNCLGLRPKETLVIITEEHKLDEAKTWRLAASTLRVTPSLLVLPPQAANSRDVPENVAAAMETSSASLLVVSEQLVQLFGHAQSKRRVIEAGSRFAAVIGNMESTPSRADLLLMKHRAEAVSRIFSNGREVKFSSKNGTRLQASIKNRAGVALSPFVTKPGSWGAIPHHSEALVSPVEGSCNGTMIGDVMITGLGLVKRPVELVLEGGIVSKIKGGREAKWLNKILRSSDKNSRNVAELALGMNHLLTKPTGGFLDKCILGTCHVGFGDNSTIGGKTKSMTHLDIVFRDPYLEIDGKRINSKLLAK